MCLLIAFLVVFQYSILYSQMLLFSCRFTWSKLNSSECVRDLKSMPESKSNLEKVIIFIFDNDHHPSQNALAEDSCEKDDFTHNDYVQFPKIFRLIKVRPYALFLLFNYMVSHYFCFVSIDFYSLSSEKIYWSLNHAGHCGIPSRSTDLQQISRSPAS